MNTKLLQQLSGAKPNFDEFKLFSTKRKAGFSHEQSALHPFGRWWRRWHQTIPTNICFGLVLILNNTRYCVRDEPSTKKPGSGAHLVAVFDDLFLQANTRPVPSPTSSSAWPTVAPPSASPATPRRAAKVWRKRRGCGCRAKGWKEHLEDHST